MESKMKQTIVIFANSVKHGEHCIAGKDLETRKWIRPVSTVQGNELKFKQIQYYRDNSYNESKPLDVVKISFLQECPLQHQPENMLISNDIWKNIDPYQFKMIPDDFLDHPETIWGEGRSIQHENIKTEKIKIDQSLFLIKVSNLKLYKNNYQKRRASFKYNNHDYDLPVTDPNFDNLLQGNISSRQKILCISLGENYEGNHYKLIAGIF